MIRWITWPLTCRPIMITLGHLKVERMSGQINDQEEHFLSIVRQLKLVNQLRQKFERELFDEHSEKCLRFGRSSCWIWLLPGNFRSLINTFTMPTASSQIGWSWRQFRKPPRRAQRLFVPMPYATFARGFSNGSPASQCILPLLSPFYVRSRTGFSPTAPFPTDFGVSWLLDRLRRNEYFTINSGIAATQSQHLPLRYDAWLSPNNEQSTANSGFLFAEVGFWQKHLHGTVS